MNQQTAQDEIQDYTWSTQYILKELNPSDLTLVNASAVVGTTNITWRCLTFEFAPVNIDPVFNKITFTYTYWFATIPEDIKAIVYEMT